MPTRLMIWNIQFFTIKRIHYTKGANLKERLLNVGQSVVNRAHILNNMVNAHIFVLIETLSSRGVLGTLIGGKGAQGVQLLLTCLREQNADWCLVPPLKLVGANEAGETSNYTEGIAVFYRSDLLDFLGPYIWPQQGNTARPAGTTPPGPYPQEWADGLPANTTYAGQFQFFSDVARTQELLFVGGNNRRPFLTTFRERNAPGRLIKLVSSHPSPGTDATTAVSKLLEIREIAEANTPQIVALAGDFNLNVFATDVASKQAYRGLKLEDFQQHFTTDTSGNGCTRVRYVPEATSTAYLRHEGLDNIFTRYDGGLQRPAHNPQIIDRVVGVPGYPTDMSRSLGQLALDFPDQIERTNRFRLLLNYGHIAAQRGTSDHIALVLDL